MRRLGSLLLAALLVLSLVSLRMATASVYYGADHRAGAVRNGQSTHCAGSN